LLDAYGMTENFIYGCIFVENPVQGSVGRTLAESEMKIADNGEVLFKSQAIMKEYYLEPEKTADTVKGGYLHTGDLGHIDEKGNLYLTGRLSENFKTMKGEFISPTTLESKFSPNSTLEQVCVTGHGMDAPILLTSLSEAGKQMEKEHLNKLLTVELSRINEELLPHERIKTIFVCQDDWTAEEQLITPTLKIRRKAIEKKYLPKIQTGETDASVVWV